MNFRVGIGYDVHKLKEGADFWLGGIQIPHSKGAIGHSDADVLIHAICDAILGAANLGDIGKHFPDTSATYKGIDSKILLNKIGDLLKSHKYKISNIDSTICLQSPKISDYTSKMQQQISKVLALDVSQVSVKATTTERLGFVGNEEGVSAYSSVLIYKS